MTDFYILESNGEISTGKLNFWSEPDRMDNAIDVVEKDVEDLRYSKDYPEEKVAKLTFYDTQIPLLRRADFDQYEKIQKTYYKLMIIRGKLYDQAIDFYPALENIGLTGDNKHDIPIELEALKSFAEKNRIFV